MTILMCYCLCLMTIIQNQTMVDCTPESGPQVPHQETLGGRDLSRIVLGSGKRPVSNGSIVPETGVISTGVCHFGGMPHPENDCGSASIWAKHDILSQSAHITTHSLPESRLVPVTIYTIPNHPVPNATALGTRRSHPYPRYFNIHLLSGYIFSYLVNV